MELFSIGDIVVGSIAWAMIFAAFTAFVIRGRRVYRWAIVFKFVCFIGYIVFTLSGKGGDSESYHFHGLRFAEELNRFFTQGSSDYFFDSPFWSPYGDNTTHMQSLAGLFLLLTGGSFLGASALFSAFGLLGQIFLHKAFHLEGTVSRGSKLATFGALFLPTLAFWSGGLLKESMAMFGLGLAYYGWKRLLYSNIATSILLQVTLGLYILFLFRTQAFPCFVVAALSSLLFARDGVQGISLRRLILSLGAMGLVLWGFYLWLSSLEKTLGYSLVDVPTQLRESALRYSDQGYSDIANTVASQTWLAVALGAPLGAANAILRPFPWDIRNVLMGIAAAENLVVLWTLLFIFRRRKLIWSDAFSPFQKKEVLFSAAFVFTYAAVVGTSTLNLGTTSRYRIPAMPFLFAFAALGTIRRVPPASNDRVKIGALAGVFRDRGQDLQARSLH